MTKTKRYAMFLVCLVRGHRWIEPETAGYVRDILAIRVRCARCDMHKFETLPEPPKT